MTPTTAMTVRSRSVTTIAARRPRHSLTMLAATALTIGTLAGCSPSADPDAQALKVALTGYLAERGQLCLGKTSWPIDLTQHDVDVGARNALQLPVLERLGLVASSVAEVEVGEEGVIHRMKVRRYELTEAGRAYFVQRPVRSTVAAPPIGDFCAARLSLDHIVGWKRESSGNGSPRAVVSFTYRVDAAPWMRDAEAQKVFPVVAGVIRGGGTAQLEEAFTAGPQGWVAVDMQGS
jgi:hypothetical protein